MTHEEELSKKPYRNWVKAALGLKYLKQGIVDFVDKEVKKFLNDIGATHGLTSVSCGQCTTENVLPCPTRGICCIRRGQCSYHDNIDPTKIHRPCPNGVCDKIQSEIVNDHRYHTPTWKNTDVTKWGTNTWEIAKCYMPEAGYKDKTSAAETDCTGILSVVINAQFMQKVLTAQIKPPVGVDIFTKNKNARNAIMHSATMEVAHTELIQYIDDMVDLLNDAVKLKNQPDAVTARQKLKKIKTDDLVISTKDHLAVRQEALKAIADKESEVLQTIEQTHLDVVDGIESKHQKMMKEMSTAGTKANELLSQTCKEQTNAIEVTREKVLSSINDKATSAETSIQTKLDTSLATLQTCVDKTLKVFEHTQIEDCQQKLCLVQEELASIKQDLCTCQLDIVRLQKDINSIKDIQARHQTKVEQLQGYLQRKQKLEMKLLEKYDRHLKNIPLSPLLGEVCEDVNKIYCSPTFSEDPISNPGQHGRSTSGATRKSYKDIFYKDSRRCKNIYVIGDAGMGKSTWSQKLLNTWMNGVRNKEQCRPCEYITGDTDEDTNEDTDEHELNQILKINPWMQKELNNRKERKKKEKETNAKLMLEYEFVFYIPLRYHKSNSQILDMIEMYLFTGEELLKQITREVLECEAEKCLIVLDGLDEWSDPEQEMSVDDTGLPGRNGIHRDCTILTTSRPWKIESLRLKQTEIDRSVLIEGLDEDGTEFLVEKVVKNLNKRSGKNANARDLFTLEKSNVISQIMKVPLMLISLVCIWYETGQIDELLVSVYSGLIEILIKYAEGDTATSGRKQKLNKLSDIPNLPELKEKWSQRPCTLPGCLSDKHLCKIYGSLLLSLGELAFLSLFSHDKTTQLVFTEESILKYLNKDELAVAVQIGILSRSANVGSFLSRNFSISFLHKTIQEFLGSVFIVSGNEQQGTDMVNKYKEYCKTLKNVLEMENVLLFVTGMNPQLAGKMTEHATDLSNPMQYKQFTEIDFQTCTNVHYILVKCCRQELLLNISLGTQVDSRIVIKHLYIDSRYFFKTKKFYNNHIRQLGLQCLSLTAKVSKDELNDVCTCLTYTDTSKFIYLDIDDSYMFERVNVFPLKCAIERNECLTDISLYSLSSKEDLAIDLTNHKCLRRVCVQSYRIALHLSPEQLEEVTIISASSQFLQPIEVLNESPCLKKVTIEQENKFPTFFGAIDLTKALCLQEISIANVTISGLCTQSSCLQKVCLKHLTHLNVIQKFLDSLKFSRHLKQLECHDIGTVTVDLKNCDALEKLIINNVTAVTIPNKNHLKCVDLCDIKPEIVVEIIHNLQHNSQLEKLSIMCKAENDIKNVGHIDLTNCTNIKILDLSHVTIERITLPSCLEVVHLYDIKLDNLERGIVFSLPRSSSIQRVRLCGIKPIIAVQVLHELQYQEQLQKLDIICEIDNDQDAYMYNAGHIDLTNCANIKHLDLCRVTIERITLPNCLEEVYLRDINPDNLERGIVFSLPRSSSVHWVYLTDIKPIIAVQVLHELQFQEQLYVLDITCEDDNDQDAYNAGHIDLTNCANIRDLTLSHLTIERITLPSCLEKVYLRDIKPDNLERGIVFSLPRSSSVRCVHLTDITPIIAVQVLHELQYQEQLRELYIFYYVYNDQDAYNAGHIDLTNCANIKNLELSRVTIKRITLPNCLEEVCLRNIKPDNLERDIVFSLPRSSSVQSVRLTDIKPIIAVQVLHELQYQEQLQKLHITCEVENDQDAYNAGHIDLTNCKNLRYLTLQHIKADSIKLPDHLYEVCLCDIKHGACAGKVLSDVIQEQHYLNKIELKNCKFGSQSLVISEQMSRLSEVNIIDCEMSQESWKKIIEYVRQVRSFKSKVHLRFQYKEFSCLDKETVDSLKYSEKNDHFTVSVVC